MILLELLLEQNAVGAQQVGVTPSAKESSAATDMIDAALSLSNDARDAHNGLMPVER